MLRTRAVALPKAELRFETALSAFQQDSDGVTVTLESLTGGATTTHRCDYLVGADGARSTVRDLIGARMMDDTGAVFRKYSVVFRAPGLAGAHLHGRSVMYWLVNPDAPALLGPMDDHGRARRSMAGPVPYRRQPMAEAAARLGIPLRRLAPGDPGLRRTASCR